MGRLGTLTKAMAVLLLAAPVARAVDLQSIPGTDTQLKVYGFIRAYGVYQFNAKQMNAGSLFYNVPADGGPGNSPTDTHNQPNQQTQMYINPSRFGFATVTPTASVGDISTKLEFDLNHSDNHPGIRLAQINIGNWTVGRAWSFWNDLDAAADTVDWAGPIGSACFDTPRVALLGYTFKLDKNNSLGVALENNTGTNDGTEPLVNGIQPATNAETAYSGKPGDGKLPNLVVAYTYSDTWGHLALRGLAQHYGVYYAADTTAGTGSDRINKTEFAGMISGNVKVAKDNLILSLYYGSALGPYGTGFQAGVVDDSAHTFTPYRNLGWTLGYTHNWTDLVRSNVVLSGVQYRSDSAIPFTDGAVSTTHGSAVKTGYDAFLNTIIKLAKNCELGLEYVYEQAKPFAANAAVDQNGNPASKNSANKFEVALHASF